jgi:hypothetical protein
VANHVRRCRLQSNWFPQARLKCTVKMSLHVIRLLVRLTLYITRYDNRIQNGSHDCHGVYQS